MLLELLAVLVLVLANGFFALSEFSIIASRRARLRSQAERGRTGAAKAERLHVNPEKFLATIQVGITLVGALLGVFSGATIVRELETYFRASAVGLISQIATPLSVGMVVLFITVLSVVIGELVPKYVALSSPEKYARRVAGPITLFVRLTSFFSHLLTLAAKPVVRLLGIRQDTLGRRVSVDEINLMIVEGKERGVFGQTELEFVRSVFDFSHSTVRRAMKPRADVVGFDKNSKPSAIAAAVEKHGYSRFPIFDGTIDKVMGVVYAKDLIGVDIHDARVSLESYIREPLFVPDSMPLAKLLRLFQKGTNHMAVVLDEFGGTFGIITLEDVLEELVGEIHDEYDEEAAPVTKHSGTVAFADGNVWPGDINELLHCHLPESEAETLAGLFIDSIGRFPDLQEAVRIGDTNLTVLSKDENRILRLKIEKLADNSDDEN